MDDRITHSHTEKFMNWWYWTNRSLEQKGGEALLFGEARERYNEFIAKILKDQLHAALITAS